MQLELALLRERGVLGDNKHLGTAKSNWGKLGKTRGNWGKLGTRDSVTFAESLDPSMARKLILAYKLHRASEPQRASWSTLKVWSINQHHCCMLQTIAALKFAF